MQRRERACWGDVENRAATPRAVIISVEVAAELCGPIDISIAAQSQRRAPGEEAIVAVGLGAKAIQRCQWLSRSNHKESAATDTHVAANCGIRRATQSGGAEEFSVGGLDQAIRGGAVSAVGQRAKTIKNADLARGSHAEQCSAGGGGSIRTPGLRHAIDISIDARN